MQPAPLPQQKPALATLSVIYYSISMGAMLFGFVVLFLNYSGQGVAADTSMVQPLRYALFLLVPGAIGAGYFIYKKLLSAVDPNAPFREKFGRLQVALLIRSACIEAPGLLGAVAALVTGDNSFLLFTAIIVVILVLLRPTRNSVSDDLQLSETEKSEL